MISTAFKIRTPIIFDNKAVKYGSFYGKYDNVSLP